MFQVCMGCTKCVSCHSADVVEWLNVQELASNKKDFNMTSSTAVPYCARCLLLRKERNYCPLCNGCYEDDDYDSKVDIYSTFLYIKL